MPRTKLNQLFEDLLTDEPTIEDLDFSSPNEPIIEEIILDENWLPNATAKFPFRIKIEGYPLDHLVGCGNCFKEFRVGFKQSNCPECRGALISSDKAFYENPIYKEPISKRRP